MKSLSGKTILITGAASGIGRHMALWFAKKKAGIASATDLFCRAWAGGLQRNKVCSCGIL